VKDLFRREGFRDLFIGQTVSAFGDWMVTVALMALVLKLSKSTTAVGAVLVLRLIPAAVAGPLAARAAERWDRRRTMLTMDLVRAGMVAAIPFVHALWWVYMWAFLIEVMGLIFLPARDSSIPDLAGDDDEERLSLANGLVLASSYGTIPLGAGAFAVIQAFSPHGGFLGDQHPFALVFFADAVSFLVSFIFIRPLTMLGTASGRREEVEAFEEHGFRAAFHIPLVRTVMAPTITIALGLGTLFSLGISYVRDVLQASDAEFGVLIALFGVGAAVGLVLLRVLANGGGDLASVKVGVAVQGATIAIMSLAPNVELAFLGAAAFGAATSWTLTSAMSLLQESLTGEGRQLAFTAFHVLIRGGLSVAAIGTGVAADLIHAVHFPVVGQLPSVRLVLASSGILVFMSAGFISRRGEVLTQALPPAHPEPQPEGPGPQAQGAS
jgi:predicted MFS family arabinose efflux permease